MFYGFGSNNNISHLWANKFCHWLNAFFVVFGFCVLCLEICIWNCHLQIINDEYAIAVAVDADADPDAESVVVGVRN